MMETTEPGHKLHRRALLRNALVTGAGAVALSAASTAPAGAAEQESASVSGQPANGSRRLSVVADGAGNVVSGCLAAERASGFITAGIVALPGQVLYEVDLPTELADAKPLQIMRDLGKYRIKSGKLSRKQA